MIAAIVFGVAAIGAGAVYALWAFVARRARAAVVDTVTKEAARLNESFDREVGKLPDAEAPLNPQEVADALRKIRDRGRRPL